MSDLETLLRSTLAERAAAVEPRPDAIRAAVAATQRRRRTRSTGQALAGAAAVGAIVLAATLWHPISPPSDPTGQSAATPTTNAATATTETIAATAPVASPPSNSTTTTANLSTVAVRRIGILNATLGADYTGKPKSPSGFGGDITLTPGSPSAAGLPPGYAAAASSVVLDHTSAAANGPVDTMTAFCGALVEKGATTKACVPQQVNGLTVQRSETDAPNTKIGTWANLRIFYQRPDQLVVYTEMTIWNTAHTTTAQERATAAKWLNAQTTKLATAVTTGP